MVKAKPKGATDAISQPAEKTTLPHHASSQDTIADDDFPSAADKTRHAHANGDYPTPNSLEDGQTNRQQVFNISTSSSAALETISREPRELLNAINRIALLGIEKDLKGFDLPKIVAIGDQSAGKSSAIAAISGITVPRNHGVCTRCPTHINLKSSPNQPWKCLVSLDLHYSFENRAWKANGEPQSVHFAEVEDGKDLENILICAQAAILNPARDPLQFVNCLPSHLPKPKDFQVQFSPNLVRLDISGAQCPDLTFYDLPGIFNQSGKEDQQHLPKLVRRLVQEYIKSENNVLLLACSMDNDIENSSAASLIGEGNAKARTIGLLTKPDRLPEGTSTATWRSILEGETFQLGEGYFVTKQPSQKDLDSGVDHAKAREDEQKFFTTMPWSTEFAAFESRFGIAKLQDKLSDLLVAHIRRSIPRLLHQVNRKLAEVKAHLATLPDPPGNKSFSIVQRITFQIHSQLYLHLQGELPHNGFIRRWTDLCEKFNAALHGSRPTLVIYTDAEQQQRKLAPRPASSFSSGSPSGRRDAISIVDSDEDEKPAMSGQKRSGASLATPSPQKKQKVQIPRPSASFTGSTGGAANAANQFSLESVRKTRLDKNTSAIGTHDHRADEYLILEAIKWEEHLSEFIAAVKGEVEGLVGELLDQELKEWESTPFSVELRAHVSEFIAGAIKRHQEFAERLLESEKIKPMTLNIKSNKLNVEEETSIFRTARRRARAQIYFDDLETKSGKITSGHEREEKIRKLSDDALGPDEYAAEIETMGRVRGYYNVASASLVDSVCKAMRLDVFERLRQDQGLRDSIERKFKLHEEGGFEECKRLLAEDEGRAERREFYLKEKEKLEKAKASLDELVKSATNGMT